MKISVQNVKETPPKMDWGLCVFGAPNQKITEWIDFHQFETELSGPFTNIIIPEGFDLHKCFEDIEPFEYLDGFSPNLNKHLHLGHVSNFVLAKAFQKMGISKQIIANLGDTLEGEVNQQEALKTFYNHCQRFDYNIDKIFFASQLQLSDSLLLKDGTGDYLGTKIFSIGDQQIVGIKSSGDTSYFYQDVALAQILKGKTLYLTGFEQAEHFTNLKILFPEVNHLPLGLVAVKGKKMSSREGNVLYFNEILDLLKEKLGDDDQLIWNVLAGYILKSTPGTIKNIDLDQIDNVRQSAGLYLSYTLAKLKSAGLAILNNDYFISNELQYKALKAKQTLQPNILFSGLINVAKKISQLYEKFIIRDNPTNQKIFEPLAADLALGMKQLGLFEINKV